MSNKVSFVKEDENIMKKVMELYESAKEVVERNVDEFREIIESIENEIYRYLYFSIKTAMEANKIEKMDVGTLADCSAEYLRRLFDFLSTPPTYVNGVNYVYRKLKEEGLIDG